MNINLITAKNNLIDVIYRNNGVLEVSRTSQDNNEVLLSFYDYKNNLVKEIAPNEKKYDFIPVYNCIWKSSEVFYGTYTSDNEKLTIHIKKYNAENDEISEILAFTDDDLVLKMEKIIKVFVLSERYIIIQTERKIDTKKKSLMGNIEFVQKLYDLKNNECSDVKELNLINNGINTIIPVSPSLIVLKTGFSHIEDNRIESQNEEDALIESVYVVGTSMFLSSIKVENSISGAKLLGTAYFDKCILSPKAVGDYIYFTSMDFSKNISETIFYNHVTGEILKAVNEEPDSTDYLDAYVINNMPYIRNSYSDRVEFFNIKESEVDMKFFDESFIEVLGNLMLFERKERNNAYLRIYNSINSELLTEEKAIYQRSCCCDDNFFIYIEK